MLLGLLPKQACLAAQAPAFEVQTDCICGASLSPSRSCIQARKHRLHGASQRQLTGPLVSHWMLAAGSNCQSAECETPGHPFITSPTSTRQGTCRLPNCPLVPSSLHLNKGVSTIFFLLSSPRQYFPSLWHCFCCCALLICNCALIQNSTKQNKTE